MERLTQAKINEVAVAAGFEGRAVRAVLKVETGGRGDDPVTGLLLIQFEPSWFRRLLPKAKLAAINAAAAAKAPTPAQVQLLADWQTTQANLVEGQKRERLAFDAATRIDAHTAQLATSWGLPQMMGFNCQACGHTSVEAMVEAFRQSEANQVEAMLRFIKSKKAMADALRDKAWGVLAYYYNGAGYKQFSYDTRLATAYAQLT